MEALTILALAVAITLILLPVAFVWYLNIGGIYVAMKKALEGRATREKAIKTGVQTK